MPFGMGDKNRRSEKDTENKQPKKVTSRDQIGKGAATSATKKVEDRKRRNRSALDIARGTMR